MVETILKVNGMMCGMCESHINDVVRKNAEVNKVSSSHTKGETVIVSEKPVDVEKLKQAIADTGYTVTGVETKPYEKKGIFLVPEEVTFDLAKLGSEGNRDADFGLWRRSSGM